MVSGLPQPSWNTTRTFSARVSCEAVSIPFRLYHDPALIDPARLTPLQLEVLFADKAIVVSRQSTSSRYYRWQRREDYVGFQIVKFFDDLTSNDK